MLLVHALTANMHRFVIQKTTGIRWRGWGTCSRNCDGHIGPERRVAPAGRTAPTMMPFAPKEMLFPTGCGEYALGVCRGDGGSGDQAKPMGLAAAPTGDAVRPMGVLAERPAAAVAGGAWQDLPVRGENV